MTTNTSSPGSSPPEIAQSFWGDVDVKGDGSYATWTQRGIIGRQVGWEEALVYAKGLYDYILPFPLSITLTQSRLAAAPVAPFQERNGDGSLSPVKSAIFISSIPRGDPNNRNARYAQLAGPNGGHHTWRNNCYYWDHQGTLHHYANDVHAEDMAINLMLNYVDSVAQQPIRWLSGKMMVVYGVQPEYNAKKQRLPARPPRQVWPCDENRYNRKRPCCQDVLDRMSIRWRVGVIPEAPPIPEPQLPQYPPDWSGGNGGGDGGSDHPASGYYSSPTDYGSDPPWAEIYGVGEASGSGNADSRHVHIQGRRFAGAQSGTINRSDHDAAPVHPNRSRPSTNRPALPCSREIDPVHPTTKQPRGASLTESLAKLSLSARPPTQLVTKATAAKNSARAPNNTTVSATRTPLLPEPTSGKVSHGKVSGHVEPNSKRHVQVPTDPRLVARQSPRTASNTNTTTTTTAKQRAAAPVQAVDCGNRQARVSGPGDGRAVVVRRDNDRE